LTPHSRSINKHHGPATMCRQGLAVRPALEPAVVSVHAAFVPVAVISIVSSLEPALKSLIPRQRLRLGGIICGCRDISVSSCVLYRYRLRSPLAQSQGITVEPWDVVRNTSVEGLCPCQVTRKWYGQHCVFSTRPT
jgi:hypothetical protein